MPRTPAPLLAALALVLAAWPAAEVAATPGDVAVSFPTPDRQPTGLCWDGERLWLADRLSDRLTALDPATGAVLRDLPAPGFVPRGLAFDGEALWCLDAEEGMIHRVDPATGVTLRSIHAFGDGPQGLAWDGTALWISDEGADLISQISTADGTVIREFPAPAGAPQGLAWDGAFLWCADRGRDRLYMIDPDSGEVLLSLDAPGAYARGLAWDGARLWCVDFQTDRVYGLVVDDGVPYKNGEPKDLRLTLHHETRNYGPGELLELDVYFALPDERPNQALLSPLRFDPEPTDRVTDRWGQPLAHWRHVDLPLAQPVRVSMSLDVRLMETRWFVFPDRVGALADIPREIRKRYLGDEDKYRLDDPVIRRAVDAALAGEERPYWMLRRLYRAVRERLAYELAGGWNVAPAVLERGNGSCSEYSFVFIALCRAAGLPARYVGSVAVRGDDASLDDVFHRWCEVYLPGYGWLPVDPSGGDQARPADVAEYFGHLAPRFLITTQGGGASEYLGWQYNADERWRSRGPVKVHVETIGEWSPLPEAGD
ncbi:MAG: transglutaminase [Candidatus Krumholzibacteriota bacterium]|nr:transglutaminase [Candidatus Krumholzibacteriota bacterium]